MGEKHPRCHGDILHQGGTEKHNGKKTLPVELSPTYGKKALMGWPAATQVDFSLMRKIITSRHKGKKNGFHSGPGLFPEQDKPRRLVVFPANEPVYIALGQDLLQREEAFAKLAD